MATISDLPLAHGMVLSPLQEFPLPLALARGA